MTRRCARGGGLAVNDAGQAAAAWRLTDAESGASHSRVRASVLD